MVLIDEFKNHLYQNTEIPSWLWRSGSYSVILGIHVVCRTALKVFNRTEVHGLPEFLKLLEARSNYIERKRGLITVSNHISVLDDPVIWGSLPLSWAVRNTHRSHRWSFASHDLCFTNTALSHFFTLGQCLPTHRIKHSPYGGLFQPTFTEAVRLLSRIDGSGYSYNPYCATIPGYKPATDLSRNAEDSRALAWPRNAVDPLSPIREDNSPPPAFPSYPNDVRVYNAPSRYANNSYSWVHIFPEGFVHQTELSERYMRYFKWGVSRLILEPPEAPDFVPMFIEGTDRIMHESRGFPRFIPRLFQNVHISFGEKVDMEAVFGDLRKRWREICDKENAAILQSQFGAIENIRDENGKKLSAQDIKNMKDLALHHLYEFQLGIISEKLKYDPEVVELRKECTRRVRDQILKVRRGRGYKDEDPKAGIAETWKLEGPQREGKMEDESWVKET